MPSSEMTQAWFNHCAWIASVREQHERMQQQQQPAAAAAALSLGFGGPSVIDPLCTAVGGMELDFDADEPVYRSLSAGLAWRVDDEVDLDFEEPVYRSLGGGVGVDAGAQANPAPAGAMEWAASMPPLVQRQRGFNGSLF